MKKIMGRLVLVSAIPGGVFAGGVDGPVIADGLSTVVTACST
jgi:hypothetical protein